MIEVGRLCVKIAGRDAGLKCVVVAGLGKGYVMIDGQTRRRKCSINHIEPLKKKLNVKKNATHADVVREFKKLKIEIKEKKSKAKKTSKPVRQRGRKKEVKEALKAEKEAKKEAKPVKEAQKKEEKKPGVKKTEKKKAPIKTKK